jgi:hypothetical protein
MDPGVRRDDVLRVRATDDCSATRLNTVVPAKAGSIRNVLNHEPKKKPRPARLF